MGRDARALVVPFQIVSGGNRMTLLAQLEAPREAGGAWGMTVTGGTIVLAVRRHDDEPLMLNRILLRAKLDPAEAAPRHRAGRHRQATSALSRCRAASISPTASRA